MNGYKTYTGISIVAIPAFARMFGFEISEMDAIAFTDQTVAAMNAVAVVVGTALAFYGRWHATKK